MDYDLFNIKDEEIDKFINEMDKILKTISERKKSGFPDYSTSYVTYLVPLTLVLLKSQDRLEKLTKWLMGTTILLGVIAIIQIIVMVRI